MIRYILTWIRIRYRRVTYFLYKFRVKPEFRGECKNGIAKWIKANGVAAGVSFLIACLLYFAIREMTDNVFEASFPVEIQTVDDEEPYVVIPSSVLVTLRGAYKDYATVNPSLRKVILSRSDIGAFDDDGMATAQIRDRNVKGVSGLAIQKISQKNVQVRRDKKADFEFELAEPRAIGDPRHGHAQVSFYSTNVVTVHGGATRLERLKQDGYKFELEPVDVSGLGDESPNDYVVYRGARVLSPSADWKLSFTPEEVRVKIVVKKEGRDRTLTGMPVKLALPASVSLPSDYEVVPSAVSVSLRGWTGIADTVSKNNVAVYADVSADMLEVPESGTKTNSVPLRVLAPADISIWSMKTDPEIVSIILRAPPKAEPPPVEPQAPEAAGIPAVRENPVLMPDSDKSDASASAAGELKPSADAGADGAAVAPKVDAAVATPAPAVPVLAE